jgi:hypothetical protein
MMRFFLFAGNGFLRTSLGTKGATIAGFLIDVIVEQGLANA